MAQTTNMFNQTTFYPAFIKDMLEAKKEVIIYSPFISKYRADFFKKTLRKLEQKDVRVFIFTRPVEEHEGYMQEEIKAAIKTYESLGVHITYIEGSIHEKVAIIDRKVIWEGSLNILSQKSSKELMVRVADEEFASKMISALGLNQRLISGYKTRGLQHKLKLDITQRIKIFLIEPVIQTIKWSLQAVFQVMILILKGILAIFSIVKVIIG